MTTVPCKGVGCLALIVFITTEAGKQMPVDPILRSECIDIGAAAGPGKRITLVTKTGKTITGQIAVDPTRGTLVVGYVPHHSTCIAATQFRKQVRRPEKPAV